MLRSRLVDNLLGCYVDSGLTQNLFRLLQISKGQNGCGRYSLD